MANSRSENQTNSEVIAFLRSWLPTEQVATILRAERRPEEEVDKIIKEYKKERKRINHLVMKFVGKIKAKYSDASKEYLLKKGIEYAQKKGFSPEEVEAFKARLLNTNPEMPHLPMAEMAHTSMTKFLGFGIDPGLILNSQASDLPALKKLTEMYQDVNTVATHQKLKEVISMYKDCSPAAMIGTYDETRDDPNCVVHPVLAALFIPIIPEIEKRMLYSNIGRMITHRNVSNLRGFAGGIKDTREEIIADYDLSVALARDPNSLSYISNESASENLIKRFEIQIALWKNVIKLRQGRYYSSAVEDRGDYVNPITKLSHLMHNFNGSDFDSADLQGIKDEGTFLRKLLATFSVRPTFTKITAATQVPTFNSPNLYTAATKVNFIGSPMVNIMLPNDTPGQTIRSISMKDTIEQQTYIGSHGRITSRNSNIISSDGVIFFYINRRYQRIQYENTAVNYKYMTAATSSSLLTEVNEMPFDYKNTVIIGGKSFNIRAVTILNKQSSHQFATYGCSTLILPSKESDVGGLFDNDPLTCFYYDPVGAMVKSYIRKPGGEIQVYQNDPVTLIHLDGNPQTGEAGFKTLATTKGTIFVYAEVKDSQ